MRELEVFYHLCDQQGRWPDQLRELLYLQLPKEGAMEAGQRRPIALLPMIYRLWAAWQKQRIQDWRSLCTSKGETPVGKGALDEAFSLAAEAERATAKDEPFAAVFLDCSECYERVDLLRLEQAAEESNFPMEALRLALDMTLYRGRRRILVNSAVSEPVVATSGIPAGCGLAVDLLHAFLQHQIHVSALTVSVRKYVDDMVLSASGRSCAVELREAFRAVKKVLESAGMQLNKTKCVVEDQVSQGRHPAGDEEGVDSQPHTLDQDMFQEEPDPVDCSHGQAGQALSDTEDIGNPPDVRVDDLMDERVHVGFDEQQMTCKKCARYVTTYKSTWRNLGTLAKQPCKPKARRQKGRAGKAAHKQSGGAKPALPPGTLHRGRTKGPNKKPRILEPAGQAAPLVLGDLETEVQRDFGLGSEARTDLNLKGGGQQFSSSAGPSLATRGRQPQGSQGFFRKEQDDEGIVCLSCIPAVVSEGIRHCGLCKGSKATFCRKHLQPRFIRGQSYSVCGDCVTAHPKNLSLIHI
eukprot:1216714-Amphidinium_carterae.2